ncbi:MAG: hypothetical protein SVX38_03335, partial [Chloroflexota bacterium]|nr:hypothetical protein [Chloroflexota bacterium]
MSLALDHQLCAAEESDLHEHLRICDDCQRQWEALQQIELLFSNTPLIGPPAGFVARVNAHLAERESRQQIIFGVMSLAVGACSLGFVSLAAVGAAVPSLYSLYLLITTPAAWHSLTVVTDLLSVAESVFSALRLAILSGFRS